jgi:hypothetical protein
MYLSKLAIFAACFASRAFAIPTEAAEADEAALAAAQYRHYPATYITNAAGKTNMDLYNGNPARGTPIYG